MSKIDAWRSLKSFDLTIRNLSDILQTREKLTNMENTKANLLRLAFIAVFLSAFGIGSAQAQFGDFSNPNPPNCNAAPSSGGGASGNLSVVGLTSTGRLICFKESAPGGATTIGTAFGFTGGDTSLIGIDFRVQDGNLYGVGNAGGIYIINRANAGLTFVNGLTVTPSGTAFGVDFNPAADRLRVISDNGQNLRHNVNSGGTTIADTTLNYNTVTATGVTGAAYTNNDLDTASSTTLFDIDATLDQVAVQSPANSGGLAATGALGVNADAASVGFDIYTTVFNGLTVGNEGFASLTVGGITRFYSVDFLTGRATSRGAFNAQDAVVDIAIPLNQR